MHNLLNTFMNQSNNRPRNKSTCCGWLALAIAFVPTLFCTWLFANAIDDAIKASNVNPVNSTMVEEKERLQHDANVNFGLAALFFVILALPFCACGKDSLLRLVKCCTPSCLLEGCSHPEEPNTFHNLYPSGPARV